VPQEPQGVVALQEELVLLDVEGSQDGQALRRLGVRRLGRRVHKYKLGRHERGCSVEYDDEDDDHGAHNDGYIDWSGCCMGRLGYVGP